MSVGRSGGSHALDRPHLGFISILLGVCCESVKAVEFHYEVGVPLNKMGRYGFSDVIATFFGISLWWECQLLLSGV